MVNTFLTSIDFAVSAKSLDRARLGKQITEAYQILLLLEDLDIVAEFLELSRAVPGWSRDRRLCWNRTVISEYKKLPYRIVRDGEKLESIDLAFDTSDVREELKAEGKRLIRFGFGSHPAVIAWIGYADALKEYIDAHIVEWRNRGYYSCRTMSGVSGAARPEWCSSEPHLRAMRASLYRKNPDAYREFETAGEFVDYLWG